MPLDTPGAPAQDQASPPTTPTAPAAKQEAYIPSQDPLLRDLLASMGETLPPEKAKGDPAPDQPNQDQAQAPGEQPSTQPPAAPSPQSQAKVTPVPAVTASPASPPAQQSPAPASAQAAPAPAPAAPAAQAAQAAQAAPAKPAVSFESVTSHLQTIPVHQGVAVPQGQQSQPADPDQAYIDQLPEDAQAEIMDMADAERFGGDKFKGAKARLVQYHKQVDALAAKLKAEDPSRTLDENDEGFKSGLSSLLKSKPRLSATDKRRVMEEAIAQRARDAAVQAVAPEINRVSRANAEVASREKLNAALSTFEDLTKKFTIETSDIPELKQLGQEPSNPDLALESDILQANLNKSKAWVEEYAKSSRDLIVVDPSKFTPLQAEINEFLCRVGDEFAATPQGKQKQNGRDFVPMHVYREIYAKNPSELSKYWTFSEAHVVNLIAYKARNDTVAQLKHEAALREKYGYQRARRNTADSQTNPQKAANTAPAPEPVRPVSARPAPPAAMGAVKHSIPDPEFNPVVLFGLGG